MQFLPKRPQMDDTRATRTIQKRTFGWPVILALIILALVLGFALFSGVGIPELQ